MEGNKRGKFEDKRVAVRVQLVQVKVRVVEVDEALLALDRPGPAVQEHGGGLSVVLASVEEVFHSVVMEGLAHVLEDVDSADDDALGVGFAQLLGVEEGLGHSLDLLVVVVVELSAVVEHVAEVRD